MKLGRLVLSLAVVALPVRLAAAEPKEGLAPPLTKTRNVILVTTDGFRWQEVFGGADKALLNKENGGVEDLEALKSRFDRPTAQQRREALLPFLWNVVARKGQLLGDPDAGCEAKVTNGRNFSYPGYNEIFTGVADARIDSNDKVPNPNVSVFEWLNSKEAFRGRVAAFGSWDVYPYIFNRERSKLLVVAGWDPLAGYALSPEERMLNQLIASTHRIWDDNCYDSFTFHAAFQYLKRQHPRVLYIGLGETDEFAHDGRYDHYLQSAHRVDALLGMLWETLETMPEYRGATSLIVTTDHGRGDAPVEWKDHGAETKGSERIWIAVLGPDTPALGVRADARLVTQSQVAATISALLGEDFGSFALRSAPPIASVLPKSSQAPR
jgi:Type I phosphodiesterase / nucleotide pyrophosphatase